MIDTPNIFFKTFFYDMLISECIKVLSARVLLKIHVLGNPGSVFKEREKGARKIKKDLTYEIPW